MHTFLQILIGLGILQALFVSILSFRFPGSHRAVSRILATILLVTVLLMASEFLDLLQREIKVWPFQDVSILLDLLLAVLVYWLTLVILDRKKGFKAGDLIHLLPFGLGLVWLQTGFRWYGTGSPGSFSNIPDSVAILVGYKGIVWLYYMGGSLKQGYSNRSTEENFKRKQRDRLLESLVWPFIIISGISYIAFWLMYSGFALPLDSDYLGALLIVVFVYYFTYSVLREPDLFLSIRKKRLRPKYSNSSLNREQIEAFQRKLRSYMEMQRPYLNDNLKLPDLAHALDISPNDLSQAINEGMGKTFYEYLNEYRLAEVKRKLLDPSEDYKTILALALESGFQSKASFNRIFKLKEGMTPSTFKDTFRSQPIE